MGLGMERVGDGGVYGGEGMEETVWNEGLVEGWSWDLGIRFGLC